MTIIEDRLAAALRTDAERFTATPDLTRTLVRGRRIRRRRVGASLIAAALVIAGIGVTVGSTSTGGETTGSAPSPFHPIAATPLATRVGSSMVSLGTDVFVWGGQAMDPKTVVPVYSGEPPQPTTGPPVPATVAPGLLSDGAIYSATADSWRPIATSPLAGRIAAPVVVTQAGVLVVGGSREGSLTMADLSDGALYDPVGDTWTRIPNAPFCVHNAVAQGALVYAAGTACGSETTPAFGVLNAMTGEWKNEPAPPSGLQHLLPYDHTVVAIGILGAAAQLLPNQTWKQLPPVPGTGDGVARQAYVNEFVTGSNGTNVFTVGEVNYGAGGVVISTLSEGRWTEVAHVARSAQLAHPPQVDTQAAISGDLLIWRSSKGISWLSLTTHRTGSAPVTGSDPSAMTAVQLAPIDGRGFLWWGGYAGGGRLPHTQRLLSTGTLITVS